ncbi:hypothetical protein BDR04DRAFT_16695 [Suillus decipiens]|nr:hypothetical protein BDR04DRAFT_16695 [Suillus decipiens]
MVRGRGAILTRLAITCTFTQSHFIPRNFTFYPNRSLWTVNEDSFSCDLCMQLHQWLSRVDASTDCTRLSNGSLCSRPNLPTLSRVGTLRETLSICRGERKTGKRHCCIPHGLLL